MVSDATSFATVCEFIPRGIADRRLILATALASASVGILVSHNHPSGNLKPSQPDIELTQKLKDGTSILDFQLLDHITLTKERLLLLCR
jgi:DNA repair protein RadC